jgi:hypothetical protein
MTSNENLISLDFSKRLEIRINNTKPVILTDLTLALLGVGSQFEKFIENEIPEGNAPISSQLYIKEVRAGSIVIELIAQALPVVPLLWNGGSISEWIDYTKDVFDWLNGKLENPPKKITKQDLKQYANILEPVAKDFGASLSFAAYNGNIVIEKIIINSQQANAAQNSIVREIEKIDAPNNNIRKKCVMTWHQTRFSEKSSTGDKAIIEEITKAPIRVIFENNQIKKEILAGVAQIDKPWHELAYIVDVHVQTIHGVVKVYTITNFYPDETFDPNE